MNKKEFYTMMKQVPKAELHLHIEAVPTLKTIQTVYKKCNGKEMSAQELKDLFTYDDLNGFIQAFIKIQNMYTSVEDFNLIFDDLETYLVDNGIVYTEAFFAPTAFLKKGFKYEEMIAVFSKRIKEIKTKHGITIKLLMDVSRTFGCENAMNNYNLLKQYPCKDIIGIGLGGAESKGPAKEYAPVYEQAIKDGFKVVAHAGEDVGPESIWDAINYLHTQRVGHGITAIQDEKLMEHCAKTQLPIEICITSNTFTKKIVSEAKNHPIKDFYKKGMMVTVNTDDPVFFKTDLINEFYICKKELKFSSEELKQLVKNGFIASYLSDKEKVEWLKKVDATFKMD